MWTALLLVASQGFGGAPEPAPADQSQPVDKSEAAAELPCRVQLDDGRWAACDTLFERPAGQAVSAPREGEGRVEVKLKEPDWDAETERELEGPLGETIKRVRKERAPTLLSELRKEVDKLRRRAEWLEGNVDEHPGLEPEAEAAQKVLAERRAVLADVEVIGLRKRERCVDERGAPGAIPAQRLPVGLRLPLDLPLVQRLIVFPDPEGCDRHELVSPAVIARVEELHRIEERLETEKFGYFRVKERHALEKKRDALLAEVKGRQGLARFGDDGAWTKPEPMQSAKPGQGAMKPMKPLVP